LCASCGISEQEKAQQERQAAAQQRRLIVEASEPVRLLSSSPEFELSTYEADTVLEVLEIRAVQIGLPKAAAAWLKLEFSGAIISHEKTLKEAGLCDQAEINVQGEEKAKLKEQANKVDIHSAARQGNAAEVKSMLAFYPDRVNLKDQVRVPSAPRAAVDSVWVGGQDGRTPLYEAAYSNRCEVAEILITAGANVNAKNKVTILYALSQLLIVCWWIDSLGKLL
jgi:hypothetical protein